MKYMLWLLSLCLLLCGCSAADPGTTVPATTASLQTTAPTEATLPREVFLEVLREGEISQIPAVMVNTSIGGYTVAMDESYFVHKGEEGLDEFLYETWEGSQPVGYSIGIYVDAARSFEEQMLETYGNLYLAYSPAAETVVAGYPATELAFQNLLEDPSYYRHCFLVRCGAVAYEIQVTFTQEMYEGLYPIIRASLDTLTQLP